MSPLVYIVIVNYKRWTDTIECLESLLRSSYLNYKIVVIDNHSQNDSVQQISAWAAGKSPFYPINPKLDYIFSGSWKRELSFCTIEEAELEFLDPSASTPVLTIVQATQNRGFAAGNNLLLKKLFAVDCYVWMLNPDMVVEEGTLQHLLAHFRQKSQKIILGAHTKSYESPLQTLHLGAGKINFFTGTVSMLDKQSEQSQIEYISGGALFTSSSSFKELGLLDERFFLYWEETEWCHLAKKQGYSLLVCEKAIVYDKISTSIGRGYLAEYYYTLNALRFIKKNKHNKLPLVLGFNVIRMTKRIFLLRYERALAVAKATVDFIRKGDL